jgi:hypothetical protein
MSGSCNLDSFPMVGGRTDIPGPIAATTDAQTAAPATESCALLEPLLPGVGVHHVGAGRTQAERCFRDLRRSCSRPGEVRRNRVSPSAAMPAIVGRLETSEGDPIAYRRVWRCFTRQLGPRESFDEREQPDDDVRTDADGNEFRVRRRRALGDWPSRCVPCAEWRWAQRRWRYAQLVRVERESSEVDTTGPHGARSLRDGKVVAAYGAPSLPPVAVRGEFDGGCVSREDSRRCRPAATSSVPLPGGGYCCRRAAAESSMHPGHPSVCALCAGKRVVSFCRLRIGGSIAGALSRRGRTQRRRRSPRWTLVDEVLAWTLRASDDGRFEFEQQRRRPGTRSWQRRVRICAHFPPKTVDRARLLAKSIGARLSPICRSVPVRPGGSPYDGPRRLADFSVIAGAAAVPRLGLRFSRWTPERSCSSRRE